MSRNAFVPLEWLTAPIGGEALRTLILISTYADNKTGECWPTNRVLLSVLQKDERNLQRDLKQLVDAGLISIQDGQGKNRRFRIESPCWFDKPEKKNRQKIDHNPGEKRRGSTPAKTVGDDKTTPAENAGDTPAKTVGDTPAENAGVLIRTLLGNSLNELSEKSGSVSEESEPGRFSEDCRSAFSDLGQKPEPIPAEIKRMATAIGAEAWIGQVSFQEISMSDWRIAETLRILQARGGNKGPNYAWTIFRGLPAEPPKPSANGHAGTQGKPKESLELIKAKAGLATARRLLPRGESTPEEVAKYEKRVEEALRKAEMV